MVTLTNVGTNYDGIVASQGLGIARMDFTGITSVKFDVRVNKVGGGTQSWQLWNETDGAEIGVIADSGPTGVKMLSVTITGAAIPTGEKVIRVRCRSTTGTDDPVFLGVSVYAR